MFAFTLAHSNCGVAVMATYNILIMGASYGSLLASKLLFGGHSVKLVCLPAEADLINAEGFRVRLPVKGRKDPIEIDSRKLPGKVTAGGAGNVNPKDYDLVEPTYTDPTVWDNFDPALLTLCSPVPQAIRPPDEKVNVLMVTLPTNFKAAKFNDEKGTAILRQLEKEIDAVRFDPGDGSKVELPVKLRVYDSIFVPLAKWSMLLAGNYRCVTEDNMRTAQEAMHSDPAK